MSKINNETEENALSYRDEVFKYCIWFACIYIVIGIALTFSSKTCVDNSWFIWRCAKANEVGDWLAGFFAPLAFLGIIATVLIQGKELELQREELKETKQELRRSADAQEESQSALNKTIYAQTFKVALDILESKDIIDDRKTLLLSDPNSLAKPQQMSDGLAQVADRVIPPQIHWVNK